MPGGVQGAAGALLVIDQHLRATVSAVRGRTDQKMTMMACWATRASPVSSSAQLGNSSDGSSDSGDGSSSSDGSDDGSHVDASDSEPNGPQRRRQHILQLLRQAPGPSPPHPSQPRSSPKVLLQQKGPGKLHLMARCELMLGLPV